MKTVLKWISNLADHVFGYDYFISYAHSDGGNYPEKLAQNLRNNNYAVFLDKSDYHVGINLKAATKRRVRMSKYLILVGRPAAFDSIWVKRELEVSERNKTTPVVININDSVDHIPSENEVVQLIKERLFISEKIEGLDGDPTPNTIGRIIQSFEATRQDQKRNRFILFVALLFLGIAAVAIWQASVATSQRQLAETNQHKAESNEAEAKKQENLARQSATEAIAQENLARKNEAEAKRQERIAQENERRAREQEEIAIENRKEAERQRDFAQEQTIIAQLERDTANHRLLISAAQSLIRESSREVGAKSMVIARQAYYMNEKYDLGLKDQIDDVLRTKLSFRFHNEFDKQDDLINLTISADGRFLIGVNDFFQKVEMHLISGNTIRKTYESDAKGFSYGNNLMFHGDQLGFSAYREPGEIVWWRIAGDSMVHEKTYKVPSIDGLKYAFSSDGQKLAFTSADEVYLFTAGFASSLGQYPIRDEFSVDHAIDISDDGETVVFAQYKEESRKMHLYRWDLGVDSNPIDESFRMEMPFETLDDIQISPGKKFYAISGITVEGNGGVVLIETSGKKRKFKQFVEGESIANMAFSVDDNWLALGSQLSYMDEYPRPTGLTLCPLQTLKNAEEKPELACETTRFSSTVNNLRFLTRDLHQPFDGPDLFFSEGVKVHHWNDLNGGFPGRTSYHLKDEVVSGFAIHQDSLIVTGNAGSLRNWNLAFSDLSRSEIKYEEAYPWVFSQHGKFYASNDFEFMIVDTETTRKVFEQDGYVSKFDMSDNGASVAFISRDSLFVYESISNRLIYTIPVGSEVEFLALNQDGSVLAVLFPDNTVFVVDLITYDSNSIVSTYDIHKILFNSDSGLYALTENDHLLEANIDHNIFDRVEIGFHDVSDMIMASPETFYFTSYNEIYELDRASRNVKFVARLNHFANQLSIDSGGNTLAAIEEGGETIMLVDLKQKNKPVEVVLEGLEIYHIVIHPNGQEVYVETYNPANDGEINHYRIPTTQALIQKVDDVVWRQLEADDLFDVTASKLIDLILESDPE